MYTHSVLLLGTVMHQGKKASVPAATMWATVLYPTFPFPHQGGKGSHNVEQVPGLADKEIFNSQGMHSTNRLHSFSLVGPKYSSVITSNQTALTEQLPTYQGDAKHKNWTQAWIYFSWPVNLCDFFFFKFKARILWIYQFTTCFKSRLTQFCKSTGLTWKWSSASAFPPCMD